MQRGSEAVVAKRFPCLPIFLSSDEAETPETLLGTAASSGNKSAGFDGQGARKSVADTSRSDKSLLFTTRSQGLNFGQIWPSGFYLHLFAANQIYPLPSASPSPRFSRQEGLFSQITTLVFSGQLY